MKGIPSYMRVQMWTNLGKIEQLKEHFYVSFCQYIKIKSYFSPQVNSISEFDDKISLYENILRHSKT